MTTQLYDAPPPTPREDDYPALLVGYDQVEAFQKQVEAPFKDLNRNQTQLMERLARQERDLEAIRELIPRAIEAWGSGRDDEARQLLRDAAARAASQGG